MFEEKSQWQTALKIVTSWDLYVVQSIMSATHKLGHRDVRGLSVADPCLIS